MKTLSRNKHNRIKRVVGMIAVTLSLAALWVGAKYGVSAETVVTASSVVYQETESVPLHLQQWGSRDVPQFVLEVFHNWPANGSDNGFDVNDHRLYGYRSGDFWNHFNTGYYLGDRWTSPNSPPLLGRFTFSISEERISGSEKKDYTFLGSLSIDDAIGSSFRIIGKDGTNYDTYSAGDAEKIYIEDGDTLFLEDYAESSTYKPAFNRRFYDTNIRFASEEDRAEIFGDKDYCRYNILENYHQSTLTTGIYYFVSDTPTNPENKITLDKLRKSIWSDIAQFGTNDSYQYQMLDYTESDPGAWTGIYGGYDYYYFMEDAQKKYFYLTPISERLYGWDAGGRYMGTELLDDIIAESLRTMGAQPYNPSQGVPIKEMGKTITFVRVNVEALQVFADTWTNIQDRSIIYPIFSLCNYSVEKEKIELTEPTVTDLDSNSYSSNASNSVLRDTSVIVKGGNLPDVDTLNTYYYLSSTDYTTEEVSNLSGWTPISDEHITVNLQSAGLSGDHRYLYVMNRESRTNGNGAGNNYPSQYADSAIVKYTFAFDRGQPQGDFSLITAGASVDVDDTYQITCTNANAAIFYTTDGTAPEFTRYTGLDLTDTEGNVITLERLEGEAGAGDTMAFVQGLSTEYNFLRVNGFWYSCPMRVQQYIRETVLLVDAQVRANNRLLIRTVAVEQGLEIGNPVSLIVPFSLKRSVAEPVSYIPTSEEDPTVVTMGDILDLTCITANSEIYYTTNGSAPVITVIQDDNGNRVTAPGNSATRKYTETIQITDAFAAYGSNVTFLVKAVCYEDGYRAMNDSDTVRFVYHVDQQTPIESVKAVPETDTASPYVIATGRTILLYCDTEGVIIYYTIDGTEPTRNADGTLADNTYEYNASQGVVVPPQQDTLFTITAMAYKEGLSNSDISRFVYQYPDPISAPYATPGSGTVTENTEISLQSSTDGTVIYYQIAYDGQEPEDPTEDSNVFDPASPIRITRETRIKAIAVAGGTSSNISQFNYTVSSKLSVPTPSISSGAVVANGTTITLSVDEGAAIHYTTDGSNPADSANTNVNIGSTVFLDGTAGSVVTIRTYASRTGYSNSEIASYSYTISNYENAIFSDKESGTTLKNGDIVTLNTDVTGAVIYYTTNGSEPTTASSRGSVVTVTGASGSTVVLKAIAVVPGSGRNSAAATFTYPITRKLGTPRSSIPSGAVFTEPGQVSLSAAAGTIYYTTDGSAPNSNSSVYSDPIQINRGMTLRAVAIADDADDSDIITYTYAFANQVAAPEATLDSGQLDIGSQVGLSCETEGAVIYYTTNGTDPDPDYLSSLTLYTSPITINSAMTLKAIAVKEGMQDSTVTTLGYTVKEPIVVEKDDTTVGTETTDVSNGTGRLQSRRSFEDSGSGPSFSDILLKNSIYGVLVASAFDVIPDETQLNVNRMQTDGTTRSLIKQNLGETFDVISNYEITLICNGENVQPEGEIEVGIPIPAEYENAVIYVAYVSEDGAVETKDTRRSGGIAYAKVDHLSQYCLAAPVITEEDNENILLRVILIIGAVVIVAGVIGGVIYRRRNYYDR